MVIVSEVLNRQDGEDEYHTTDDPPTGFDPRRRGLEHRCWSPR